MIIKLLTNKPLPKFGISLKLIMNNRGLIYRTSNNVIKTKQFNSKNVNIGIINLFIRYNSNKSFDSQNSTKSSISDPTTSDNTKALSNSTANTAVSKEKEPTKKMTTWEKVKHEAKHYWAGTKLLGYEIKVSTKLLIKMFGGYALSRRESNQLQRTLSDLVRLVPFAALILIPFAELLIPVIVRIFPNFLPSTYESQKSRKLKSAKLFKAKTSASEYIRNTIKESGLKITKINDEDREAFVKFFDIISIGNTPSRDHLIKVARLFRNDQVLDNLSRPQLLAMSKYMNITSFGTDSILRYQIRHRLLNIIKDDKAIDYEGVDSLTIPELKYACQQRGISTKNVSPGRLRDYLETWLDLRLRQKIPSSLLILTSTYTYGETHDIETYYDALLAVLSSIPDEVYNVAKLQLSDDSKLKLDILKEQDELINEENLREKDTVTHVKDEIKLDELEEASEEGMEIEPERGTPKDVKQNEKDSGDSDLEVKNSSSSKNDEEASNEPIKVDTSSESKLRPESKDETKRPSAEF